MSTTGVEIPVVHQLIGGAWGPADSGEWTEVENPGRREIIGRVPASGASDVDRAVAAAKEAFPAWRARPSRERGALLIKLGDKIAEHQEELARIIASETGNALRTQARGEAASAVDIFRYYGQVASEQKGETLPLGDGLLSYTVREPLGVVGGIVPWNAPVQLSALKIAMALSMGNTLVLKTAELAPLGVLRMAQWAAEILPDGVLNVLSGSGAVAGARIASHPDIAKLTFTGSTGVGRSILAAAADRIVPVTLELGGKSPVIVFPDSDDDATVDGVIMGMRFTRQGQSCTAGSRLYLHEDIFDSFLQKLTAKLAQLKIGDPLDEDSDIGAIVSETQYDKVCDYIQSALDKGGKLITGGVQKPVDQDGYYVAPTVISGVDADWEITREEVFGPVLVVIPWRDEDEVVAAANDSAYGLAGYVWSKNIDQALRTAHRLEVGWIQINRGGGQIPGMAYGGIKQSGLGREYSVDGALESFTQHKSFTIAYTA
ncbi:aldehyde dehydrogenase family protein [Streptomyces sp. NPDC047453]|uniref:aldehyde dehydrogenase family protein n=1 Tax=Streptomyces sp. NPDC047453 TaxID=3154812 RepID=UPI0033BFF9DF